MKIKEEELEDEATKVKEEEVEEDKKTEERVKVKEGQQGEEKRKENEAKFKEREQEGNAEEILLNEPPEIGKTRRRRNILVGWLCSRIVKAFVKNKVLL